MVGGSISGSSASAGAPRWKSPASASASNSSRGSLALRLDLVRGGNGSGSQLTCRVEGERTGEGCRAGESPVKSPLKRVPSSRAMPLAPPRSRQWTRLLPSLLGTLERIACVQRHLYPPIAVRLAIGARAARRALASPLRTLEAVEWPADARFLRDRLVDVTRQTLALVEAFETAARTAEDPIGLYRALRRFAPPRRRLSAGAGARRGEPLVPRSRAAR